MEQFEPIAYHRRCVVLQARGWRDEDETPEAWSCREERWDSVERGELQYQLRETIMGNFPETSATAAAKSRRFARQVRFPPYTPRASTELHVILRSCFRRYICMLDTLSRRSKSTCVQQVSRKRLDSVMCKLETLLIHQFLASY